MKTCETFSVPSRNKPCGYILLAFAFVCLLSAAAIILYFEFRQQTRLSDNEIYDLLLKLNKQDKKIFELEKRILALERRQDASQPYLKQGTASIKKPREASMPVGPVSSSVMNVFMYNSSFDKNPYSAIEI